MASCLLGVSLTGGLQQVKRDSKKNQITVSLVKSEDREAAIRAAVENMGDSVSFSGRKIYLKGNFNSPDAFPATTHPDALRVVVKILKKGGCGQLILAERSGMGGTRDIWQELGIDSLAGDLGLELVALDEMAPQDWRKEELSGSHWQRGIEVPSFLDSDTCVVQISNLKTHRFGGEFSASLKNSVGFISKHSHSGAPHNYMEELHGSKDQRLMIAEINEVYKPALVIIDAMSVFIDGGPEAGELATPGTILASKDRVAIDATGVALLRHYGAERILGRETVFEQAQIKRAAELQLGAKSGDEIRILTRDEESSYLADQLKAIMTEEAQGDKK